MTRKQAPRRTRAPGRVRIIGGTLRGSVLAVPEHAGLRPTPGRVRETLFNWLQPHLTGRSCLDLFAGSGALGIEALSRGAAHACLVERDATLATALQANLARLHQDVRATVRAGDAMAMLAEPPVRAFDVVFVDPPFADDLWAAATARLEASGWLAPRAWIYVEMPAGLAWAAPTTWTEQRTTRAGEVRAVLYRRLGNPLS